MKYMDNNFI